MLKAESHRWTGLRFCTAKTQVLLLFLLMAATVMPSCATTADYTEDDVIFAFIDVAREQTLPECPEDIVLWWSSTLPLAQAKYIEKTDTYEIAFPNFGGEGVEIWGIDTKTSRIWPVNAGALMSAIVLFCHDRNDQRLDCQLWFAQLDALAQSIGQ